MLGSEYVAMFKGKGLPAWEAAALELAREGSSVAWPMVNIALSMPPDPKTGAPGHTGVLPVASDLFAIGTPADFVYLPLTPQTAQTIANLTGALLPTPKIVYEIWKAAEAQGVQLTPEPQTNRGDNLAEFARHSATIQAQLAKLAALGRYTPGMLMTGHKKDVIISNIARKGYVLIYGWFWPASLGKPLKTCPWPVPPGCFSQPIQPRSNVHVTSFLDYSHGIRLVSPVMLVDGEQRKTEDILRDPILSKLLSDEGPVHTIRYPAENNPAPYRPASHAEYVSLSNVYPRPATTSLADQGLAFLMEEARRKRTP